MAPAVTGELEPLARYVLDAPNATSGRPGTPMGVYSGQE